MNSDRMCKDNGSEVVEDTTLNYSNGIESLGKSLTQDRKDMDMIFFDGKKKTYLCLNHRAAYLCWLDANEKGFIKDNALLFHIDHHADFWLHGEKLIDEQEDIDDEKELKEFVRTKLSVLNSEFIVLSMFRGVIGDVISISRKNDKIYGTLKKGGYDSTERSLFKDRKDNTHTFYLGGHSILELAGYNGLLTDRHTHQDVQEVFDKSQNVILDIDLDFFTYKGDEGKSWAMNERHLEKLFSSEVFDLILRKSKVITIALEPSCCGGNAECVSILDKLNLVLKRYNIDVRDEAIEQFKLQAT